MAAFLLPRRAPSPRPPPPLRGQEDFTSSEARYPAGPGVYPLSTQFVGEGGEERAG